MAFPFGALISAGGSLLGGLLGSNSDKKLAAQNREYQENQLQYMVRDAKKAGISPLAALGQADYARPLQSQGNPLGQGIANAGAALGKGISSIQTAQQIERGDLENDLLRAQIKQANAIASHRAATNASNQNSRRGISDNNPATVDRVTLTDADGNVLGSEINPKRVDPEVDIWNTMRDVMRRYFTDKPKIDAGKGWFPDIKYRDRNRPKEKPVRFYEPRHSPRYRTNSRRQGNAP